MHLTVTLTARDFAADLAGYDELFSSLGWQRVVELVDEEEDDAEVEAVGWGPAHGGDALVWLVTGAEPTCGVHLRLPARSRQHVEAFWSAAEQWGWALSRPRRWPIYRQGEFSASALDPAGNRLEAVSAE